MESSPTIEQYVAEKNKKIVRILEKERDPQLLEVILESHKTHAQYAVELRLHAADYHDLVKKSGTDLYGLIDLAFDALVHEIRKKKEFNIDKRKATS
jgi:ribosome-associated translation inhibitor RaiA